MIIMEHNKNKCTHPGFSGNTEDGAAGSIWDKRREVLREEFIHSLLFKWNPGQVEKRRHGNLSAWLKGRDCQQVTSAVNLRSTTFCLGPYGL